MPDRDPASPSARADAIDFDALAAHYGKLPEIVTAADLEQLNAALAEMFGKLREAAGLRPTNERAAAVQELLGVAYFVMRFENGLAQNLHAPLMGLASALLALDNNKVEPLVAPTGTRSGGRAPDSPARQALIGFAVGAVERLRWTGLPRPDAHKAVADALHRIGISPGRGSARVTSRTVREW
ncbi:MAG: hypothetical protein ACREE9_05095, partial [Stellaceae bacterium]